MRVRHRVLASYSGIARAGVSGDVESRIGSVALGLRSRSDGCFHEGASHRCVRKRTLASVIAPAKPERPVLIGFSRIAFKDPLSPPNFASRVYRTRSTLFDKRRKLMQAWNAFATAKPASVIPVRARNHPTIVVSNRSGRRSRPLHGVFVCVVALVLFQAPAAEAAVEADFNSDGVFDRITIFESSPDSRSRSRPPIWIKTAIRISLPFPIAG